MPARIDVAKYLGSGLGRAMLLALTFGVVVINWWNQLSVSFRPVVGSYQPNAVAV